MLRPHRKIRRLGAIGICAIVFGLSVGAHPASALPNPDRELERSGYAWYQFDNQWWVL